MATDSASFFEKVPEIIEASAKSPPAFAALVLLVLGFLAYIYFREAKEKTRVIIFVVLTIVAFLLVMAVLSGVRQSTPDQWSGTQPRTVPQPVAPPAEGEKPSPPSGERRQARVEVGTPVISQGVMGAGGLGISILVPGRIRDAKGLNAQLVINFSFPNGTPVWASPVETIYRAASGVVATGTSVFQLTTDDFDLSAAPVYIPYYAFNMMPSGYYNRIDLMLIASVYLNGAVMARSPAAPFYFMW